MKKAVSGTNKNLASLLLTILSKIAARMTDSKEDRQCCGLKQSNHHRRIRLKERLLDLNPVSLRGKAVVVYSFNQIEKQEPM